MLLSLKKSPKKKTEDELILVNVNKEMNQMETSSMQKTTNEKKKFDTKKEDRQKWRKHVFLLLLL